MPPDERSGTEFELLMFTPDDLAIFQSQAGEVSKRTGDPDVISLDQRSCPGAVAVVDFSGGELPVLPTLITRFSIEAGEDVAIVGDVATAGDYDTLAGRETTQSTAGQFSSPGELCFVRQVVGEPGERSSPVFSPPAGPVIGNGLSFRIRYSFFLTSLLSAGRAATCSSSSSTKPTLVSSEISSFGCVTMSSNACRI